MDDNTIYKLRKAPAGNILLISEKGLKSFNGTSFTNLLPQYPLDFISWGTPNDTTIWLLSYSGEVIAYNMLTGTSNNLNDFYGFSSMKNAKQPYLLSYFYDNGVLLSKIPRSVNTHIDFFKGNCYSDTLTSQKVLENQLTKIFPDDSIVVKKMITGKKIRDANFDKPYWIIDNLVVKEEKGKLKIVFDGKDQGITSRITSVSESIDRLYLSILDVGVLEYRFNQKKQITSIDTIFKNPNISKIYFDNSNHLWLTSIKDGVYFQNNKLSKLKLLSGIPNHIEDITCDKENVYICFEGSSIVYVYNTVSRIASRINLKIDLPGNKRLLNTSNAIYLATETQILQIKKKKNGQLTNRIVTNKLNSKGFVYKVHSDKVYLSGSDFIYIIKKDGHQEKVHASTSCKPASFDFLPNGVIISSSGNEISIDGKQPVLSCNSAVKKIKVAGNTLLFSTNKATYWADLPNLIGGKPVKHLLLNEESIAMEFDSLHLYCLSSKFLNVYEREHMKCVMSLNINLLCDNSIFTSLCKSGNDLFLSTESALYRLSTQRINYGISLPTFLISKDGNYLTDSIIELKFAKNLSFELKVDVLNYEQKPFEGYYSILKDNDTIICNQLIDYKLPIYLRFPEPGAYRVFFCLNSTQQGWQVIANRHFNVIPLWWQTKTALLFFCLIGLGAVVFVVNFTIKYYKKLLNNKLYLIYRLQESEFKNVLGQLKPHFIFNALIPFQYYILSDNKDEGLEYFDNFSKMTRTLMEVIKEKHISIEKEVFFLKQYLKVQQSRYSSKFNFEINIDIRIDSAHLLIPSLMIQPIVENAVEHGLDFNSPDQKIEINFVLKKNNIYIEVVDNGIGLPKDFEINENHALGLIRSHLNLLKKQYNSVAFCFSSTTTTTIFELKLPIIRKYD